MQLLKSSLSKLFRSILFRVLCSRWMWTGFQIYLQETIFMKYCPGICLQPAGTATFGTFGFHTSATVAKELPDQKKKSLSINQFVGIWMKTAVIAFQSQKMIAAQELFSMRYSLQFFESKKAWRRNYIHRVFIIIQTSPLSPIPSHPHVINIADVKS